MKITITNHKGGTGKTTSTLNIACVLRDLGYKTLILDLDPQANLSYSLGVSKPLYSIGDWLNSSVDFNKVKQEIHGVSILPASQKLIDFEKKFQGQYMLLSEKLKGLPFHFILIDCPPSFGVYTINALNASQFVVIPTLLDVLSIQGVQQIVEKIREIQFTSNPYLKILGAIGVAVNNGRKLSEEIKGVFDQVCGVQLFNQMIRSNVKVAEAPSYAMSVIDYSPMCSSSMDYVKLTSEIIDEIKCHYNINHIEEVVA